MHPRRIRDLAIALYDKGHSARDVSKGLEKQVGVYISPQAVARWMREVGRSRPAGEPRSVELDAQAKRLYESGATVEQIARRYRIGKTSAAKCLREMGVAIRPSGSRFLHLLAREGLQRLYVLEGRSVKSIADELGCSLGAVYRLLKANGIRRPD